MRAVWRTPVTSVVSRRSRSALSRTTSGRSIRDNRHVSASCCWDCRRYVLCRHTSLNSCSSYDLSARRRLTLWSVTCCSVAALSTGRTCPFSSLAHPRPRSALIRLDNKFSNHKGPPYNGKIRGQFCCNSAVLLNSSPVVSVHIVYRVAVPLSNIARWSLKPRPQYAAIVSKQRCRMLQFERYLFSRLLPLFIYLFYRVLFYFVLSNLYLMYFCANIM